MEYFPQLKKLFPANRWIIWVGLSLLVNIFYFQVQREHRGQTDFYLIDGDQTQYVNSAEGFFQTGNFRFGKLPLQSNFAKDDDLKAIDYTFRTPGFAFFYLPLRCIMSQDLTCRTIIVFQVALSAVAKYLACLIVWELTGSMLLFYICFLLINVLPGSVLFNNHLLTESLALSILTIAIYLWVKNSKPSNKILFWVGLCLFLVFQLRPFMGILYPIFLVLIYFKDKRLFLKKHVVFLVPLLIFQPIWVVRNYIILGRFVPIADTRSWKHTSNYAYLNIVKLSQLAGANTNFWEKDSPMNWLCNNPQDLEVPKILIDQLGLQKAETNSLAEAKRLFFLSTDKTITLSRRMKAELETRSILVKIISNVKNQGIYRSEVLPRFYYARHLLNQPVFRYFVSIKYPLNIALTAFEYFLVRLVFYIGIFFSALAILKSILFPPHRNSNVFILGFIPVFLLCFFANMQLSEFREMYMAFPFLIISTLIYLHKSKSYFVDYGLLFPISLFGIFKTYGYIVDTIKF